MFDKDIEIVKANCNPELLESIQKVVIMAIGKSDLPISVSQGMYIAEIVKTIVLEDNS